MTSSLRFLRAAIVAGVWLAGAEARASETKSASLSWFRMPGADTCVATQALARAVEERLGHPVFVSAAEAELSVEGRIERRRGSWHATLTLRDASGKTLGVRELDRSEASCEAMTEPLVLVVAVMIDPEGATRPKAPAPEQPTPEQPTAEPTKSEARAPAEPAPPRAPAPPPPATPDSWRFEGHVQATTALGPIETAALGAGGQAILYPPKIPVGLRGFATIFLPTEVESEGARAAIDMLYVGGAVCPTLRGRIHLLGCIGSHLGVQRPRALTPGRGISDDALPIVNAIVELRAHATIVAPFAIAAGIGGGVPLVRPDTTFERATGGTGTLNEPAPYVFTADVGLGVAFP